ncbi:MAG: GNAT family N-acetyltransferase [archaeon]
MSPEEEKKRKKPTQELKEELLKIGHEPADQLIYSEVLNHKDMEKRIGEISKVFADYLEETKFGNRNEVIEVLNGYLEKGNKMILFKTMKEKGKEEIVGFATLLVDPITKTARLNDSYLRKEYRKRGLGNRLNVKRAIIARMEGIPLEKIKKGGAFTRDGLNLHKARPKIFGRIYGVPQEQFDLLKGEKPPKQSTLESALARQRKNNLKKR